MRLLDQITTAWNNNNLASDEELAYLYERASRALNDAHGLLAGPAVVYYYAHLVQSTMQCLHARKRTDLLDRVSERLRRPGAVLEPQVDLIMHNFGQLGVRIGEQVFFRDADGTLREYYKGKSSFVQGYLVLDKTLGVVVQLGEPAEASHVDVGAMLEQLEKVRVEAGGPKLQWHPLPPQR